MAIENHSGLYAAFTARDARFDGRFFVGISSTGIYCRPVCRARKPKAENCTFYPTAAEAEQAGYRPCLLCRPELAPGASIADAAAGLAHRAVRMLEESCGSGQSLEEIAVRLGYSSRHMRRVFTAEYKVTPVQYLQTCRLLLAKSLLTDTSLSILEVAMAAGFGSLRRFNEGFKKQYQLMPTALRKSTLEQKRHRSDITLTLGYRPPYHWEEMLNFLAGRAVLGQQISVKAARTLAARIAQAYGTPIQTGIPGLTHIFPMPEDILALGESITDHFGTLGLTSARSSTIIELARALTQGELDFDLPAQPEEEIKRLMRIRGIGSWTAQYIAMRTMEWPDAFLETDAGVKKALPSYTPGELLKMAEAWRPWRSYAAVNLWNTL